MAPLTIMTSASGKDKAFQKILGRGIVRAGKRMALLISNKDMDDIIKIINSLESSGLLMDGVKETLRWIPGM